MRKIIEIIGLIVFMLVPVLIAQTGEHEWASLNGPYWVKTVDVAFGNTVGGTDWYRYMIGNNAEDIGLYNWKEGDVEWEFHTTPVDAIKIISYKDVFENQDSGRKAYCIIPDGSIYKTTDGGDNWAEAGYVEDNQNYTCIEIHETQTTDDEEYVFVGCELTASVASVFVSEDGGDSWADVDNGLSDKTITDLEFAAHGNGWLVAGTDDGLWKIQPYGQQDEWIDFTGDGFFDDKSIAAVAALDYHDEIWVATGGGENDRKLYWFASTSSSPQEIYIDGSQTSFNKEVNDMCCHWVGYNPNWQSVYVAASDGLYLFDMEGTQGQITRKHYIDFQTDPAYAHFPFDSDFPVLSLDYWKPERDGRTSYIMVGTENGVYLITEKRRAENAPIIEEITIEEISNGTNIADVKSLCLPDNTTNQVKIFTVDDKGLIKKTDRESWDLSGLAYPTGLTGAIGSDIAADFSGDDPIVLAASNHATGGSIMYSEDGGDSWEDRSHAGDPFINAVGLDLVSDSAYAAGEEDDNVWFSTDNGYTWYSSGSFSEPVFNDIYADPDPTRDDYVYVGGSGDIKARMYDGDNWSTIENGLASVDSVFQFAKSPEMNVIYAATDLGVYKATLGINPPAWVARTYGTSAASIGTIVCDPNNPYALLAATSPGAANPHIWASGDSARSWVEIYNGDLPEAPRVAVNRLAASQDANTGFLVGTDEGAFSLGDIFKAGPIDEDEAWGPGKVIVYGDVSIQFGTTITLVSPCTVYVTYDFDAASSDADGDHSRIFVRGTATLETDVYGGGRIVITSSRPDNKAAGDWTGIVLEPGSNVYLENCDIEYAEKGIYSYYQEDDITGPDNFTISDCTFSHMSTAGIDLYASAYEATAEISSTVFDDCGTYGIYVPHDDDDDTMPLEITDCQIADCDNGISYSGNDNGQGKYLLIEGTKITGVEGRYTGIRASKRTPELDPPIVELDSDTVTAFGTGVLLISVSSESSLSGNRIKSNSDYGLYVQASSPVAEGDSPFNAFNLNGTGIYVNESSGPTILSSQIKENVKGGVLIASHDLGQYGMPFFGDVTEHGGNSFYRTSPPINYYDMKNESQRSTASALYNWWGESTPNTNQIVGPISYYPYLLSDPLPGTAKRGLEGELPGLIALDQNYPNPFNPATTIHFTHKEPGFVSLKIFNIQGQVVRELLSGYLAEGEHAVSWDGRGGSGTEVASGVYFYLLATDQERQAKRMVLLR